MKLPHTMLHLLVVLLLTRASLSSYQDPRNIMVKTNVLAAVQKFFNSQCVFLLHTEGFDNTLYMTQIMQALAVLLIPVTTFTFESLTESREACYVYPLYVFPFGNEESILGLLEVARTRRVRCAEAIWLMFLPKSTNVDKFFTGLHVPFDCEFIVVSHVDEESVFLTEVYRINSSLPLQQIPFGYFTISTGKPMWKVSHRKFYQRRNNLQGVSLKAAYRHGAAVKNSTSGDSEGVGGFFGELWATLQEHVNFTTEYDNVGNEGKGAPSGNGSWTGLIGRIVSGEADVAVSALTVTQERGAVIDFTVPLLHSRRCVFMQKPNSNEFHWNNFLTPFSEGLWFCVGLSLLVVSTCLSATYFTVRSRVPFPLTHFGPPESLNYVYTSYVQQGCSDTPQTSSCRVIAMVAKLTATVLLAGYSASLVSHLAVHIPVMPFSSLQELAQLDYYRVGMPIHSSTYYLFQNTTDKLATTLWNKMVEKENLPSNDFDGLHRVCRRRYYLYISIRVTSLSHARRIPCQLAVLCKYGDQVQMAMAFAKRNPYLGIINYQLQNIRRSGILQRLRRKWWPPVENKEKKLWESVQWDAVAPILAIPFIGASLGLLILALERCIARMGVKRNLRTTASKSKNMVYELSEANK